MKKISKARQTTYYIGNGISLIGIILFLTFFLQVFTQISDPFPKASLQSGSQPGFVIHQDGAVVEMQAQGNSFAQSVSMPKSPSFMHPFLGMILIVTGQMIANIGKSGLAGSGLILDPEMAREDLQPFNVAKGEMLNDTLQEVEAIKSFTSLSQQAISATKETQNPLVKVRCSSCKVLNDETSKFCSQCGHQL